MQHKADHADQSALIKMIPRLRLSQPKEAGDASDSKVTEFSSSSLNVEQFTQTAALMTPLKIIDHHICVVCTTTLQRLQLLRGDNADLDLNFGTEEILEEEESLDQLKQTLQFDTTQSVY